MNFFSRLLCAVTLLTVITAAVAQTDEDWSVAVLDQILAGVQPGQRTVQIDDMIILVSNLQAWRNQLAGGPIPLLAFGGTATTWPDGNVYYTFDRSVTAAEQKVFLDSAAEWALFADLHFVPRTTQGNYVTVVETNYLGTSVLEGGNSAVGMIGGQQFIYFSSNAWNHGIICHEIGHTLGLVHEHQRSDRDSYLTVITNNVIPGGLSIFVILTDSRNQGPYDFLSVMHYAQWSGSVDPPTVPTMVPLPPYSRFADIMGQGDPKLTPYDRAGMAAIYGPGPPLTGVVTNTQSSGPGSLLAALYYAYDHPGTTITFNIPPSDPGFSNGVFTIQPTDVLPSLFNATILDATTQPNYSNSSGPSIILSGALVQPPSSGGSGLNIRGTNCVVLGLMIDGSWGPGISIYGGAQSNLVERNVISGNGWDGVEINDTNTIGNVVAGNYIGLMPDGSAAMSNGFAGVEVYSGASSNIIGGTSPGAGNVISGNAGSGVLIRFAGAIGNVVQGNLIGLNSMGNAPVPNGQGISLYGGAQSNLIGGYTPAARNVISGNEWSGVALSDTNDIVAGNYIGVAADGLTAISNLFAGIEVDSGASNVIGGTLPGSGNVISGNGNSGVLIRFAGASGNVVQGNIIGLNASGTAALANAGSGVNLYGGAQSNLLGGYTPAARNVISGNGWSGIEISDTNNVVAGNYIGIAANGSTAISNAFVGIEVDSGASNVVGGTLLGAGNLISGNAGSGVLIRFAGAIGNVVQGNLIGLNSMGNAPVPNGQGISLYGGAQSNLIGGYTPAARNVISGNEWSGVALSDTNDIVAGNYIGVAADGLTAISNLFAGIEVDSGASNVIGGTLPGSGNVISGNGNSGVLIRFAGAFGNVVQGNIIGLNATATAPLANAGSGVNLYGGAQSNLIGGLAQGAGNMISGNLGGGVSLSDAATTDNTVRANSIFENGGLGLVLYNSANNSISSPTLFTVILSTNFTMTGFIMGLPNSAYHVDFYANPAPHGDLEGMIYLGSRDVVNGLNGTTNFSVNLTSRVLAGNVITATITDLSGNTSSLSGGEAVTVVSTVGDGIPDAWRALYFGGSGTTTNSSSCATCDPDHNGMNNSEKFLAGLNPTNSASDLELVPIAPNPSNDVAMFLSAEGIVYEVQYCDDLAADSWSLLTDQILGTGTNIFIADPFALSKTNRFYRLQVLW